MPQKDYGKLDMSPGVILSFNYKGVNVHDKHPVVLILGFDTDMKLLHGINIHYLSSSQLTNLRDAFKTGKFIQKNSKSKVKLTSEFIEKDPKAFYENYVKNYLIGINKSVYRTYTLDKIYNAVNVDAFVPDRLTY